MKKTLFTRGLAIILVAVMTVTSLPINVLAAEINQQSTAVKSGMYTAPDGAEYAVLYNDYVTVYVDLLTGAFSVLPATESFDADKPLSHASFRIDGAEYDYGGYYEGESGTISIAPEMTEENLLESHWRFRHFAVFLHYDRRRA